jgi:hypothetical protein
MSDSIDNCTELQEKSYNPEDDVSRELAAEVSGLVGKPGRLASRFDAKANFPF